MSSYNHRDIERKWQSRWERDAAFRADDTSKKSRRYVLDMFPYPSSDGLHVGHPEGYTATDIYCRYLRMNGYEVLHPIGWDAFGLPAENYAIKKNIHPAETTQKNIATFKRQIKSLGFSYDWSREIDTSSPDYYRWTQWLFLQLHKHGLAYKKRAPVNWCDHCKTVLAREQVVDGACERCKDPVIQKELEQWFFKVTQYAEELLSCLDSLDWPESIKTAQRNWIGKSEGAQLHFPIHNSDLSIEVFTTRPDTLFGATYMVLAPEHPLVDQLKGRIENPSEIENYRAHARKKNERERTALDKDTSGVLVKGVLAVNPGTRETIPVWLADYVIASYGTGAIMAVPAHDERDYAFAKKFHLPIKAVIVPPDLAHIPRNALDRAASAPDALRIACECWTGPGTLINSGPFTGLSSQDAQKKITESVDGTHTTTYRLRDWLISRQRYWGAPIPIIYCDECGTVPVPNADLPVLLPTDVDFKPTGESPLVRSKTFHAIQCPSCSKPARRESDTIDTFVCSSWYYLRYTSPTDTLQPFDQERIKTWLPVSLYVGGAEHAVLHLMYARFIAKALRDMGFLPFDEPFLALRNQGMILGEDGEKMSKSRGNVINPDDVIERFGADTMRLYEMFMGPFEATKPWSTTGMIGLRRFLEKVWRFYTSRPADAATTDAPSNEYARLLHKTIYKVTHDIETFRFNTAISALMILLNTLQRCQTAGISIDRSTREIFLILLSPFAPHIAEELYERLGHTDGITAARWPAHDTALLSENVRTVILQVNGKVRDSIEVERDCSDEIVKERALARPIIQKWIARKPIARVITAQHKIVNIVTRDTPAQT